MPLSSGQIKQVSFRASSISEINRLVYSLTQYGNGVKYYSNVRAELSDSQTRLSNDVNYYHPRALTQIRNAKSYMAKALAQQMKTRQSLNDKELIAAQKHAAADDAKRTAQTSDDQIRANELQVDANLADEDVSVATSSLNVADIDVAQARKDLNDAENDLRKLNARIAQLRGIIARDRGTLNIH